MLQMMTLEEFREYVRSMPDDEILSVTFEEDEDGGDEEV